MKKLFLNTLVFALVVPLALMLFGCSGDVKKSTMSEEQLEAYMDSVEFNLFEGGMELAMTMAYEGYSADITLFNDDDGKYFMRAIVTGDDAGTMLAYFDGEYTYTKTGDEFTRADGDEGNEFSGSAASILFLVAILMNPDLASGEEDEDAPTITSITKKEQGKKTTITVVGTIENEETGAASMTMSFVISNSSVTEMAVSMSSDDYSMTYAIKAFNGNVFDKCPADLKNFVAESNED
jgi:hypothetical protein